MIGTKILEERESKYNGHLKVIKSLGLGTYIQANGLTQSGGVVESIWKQTLRQIHNSRFKIQSVLILGLGGGTVAKLVKKYWPEAEITGVEIDPVMVELGTKYLGLNKDDIKIKIGDASDFKVAGFDLVVVDLYCGDKFPERFESEKFLNKLKASKLIIFNRLYFAEKRPMAAKFGRRLEKLFSKVEWYYPEANLMFLCYN